MKKRVFVVAACVLLVLALATTAAAVQSPPDKSNAERHKERAQFIAELLNKLVAEGKITKTQAEDAINKLTKGDKAALDSLPQAVKDELKNKFKEQKAAHRQKWQENTRTKLEELVKDGSLSQAQADQVLKKLFS